MKKLDFVSFLNDIMKFPQFSILNRLCLVVQDPPSALFLHAVHYNTNKATPCYHKRHLTILDTCLLPMQNLVDLLNWHI